MFQSEIRHSEVNELLEKVANQNYGSYLQSIAIERARSFRSQKLRFDFPVTAIIGPNGGGKSTVLGAAALAYIDIKPSHFLAKSGKYDESMQKWAFDYELIDKVKSPKDIIKRRASFTSRKWYRDALKRPIRVFGVSRTVPATERKELRQCISGSYESPNPPSSLSAEVISGVAKILDKDISNFSSLKVDARGKVTLLAGITKNNEKYSEFHFGAGESSIIRMLVALDSLPVNALALIEEIENGLHPVACVRLVEHLISLAKEKSLQVIFTTHSNDALRPLPDKAIWAAVNGSLFQGKLDIASLRAITGQVETSLTIFVEDEFAATWIKTMLQNTPSVALDAVGIHSMAGDGIAVSIHKHHNEDPSIRSKSVCFIDGDSQQVEDKASFIIRLPGQSPEAYIYDAILEKAEDIIGTLAVALLKRYDEHKAILEILRSVRNTNRDPHLLFAQVGMKLGFIAEDRVKEAFLTIWAQNHTSEVSACIDAIMTLIPKDTDNVSLNAKTR